MSLVRFELIAPDTDNHGHERAEAYSIPYREYAKRLILSRFDGATAVRGHGHWVSDATGRAYADPVTVWKIDAEASREADVIRTAMQIAREADQLAVYVSAIGEHGFTRALVSPHGATDTLIPSNRKAVAV